MPDGPRPERRHDQGERHDQDEVAQPVRLPRHTERASLSKKNNEPDDRQDVGDFEQSDETVLKRHGHRSRSDTSVPNRMTTSGREGDDGEETQDADCQDARLHSPIHGESLCRVRDDRAVAASTC